MKEDLTKLATRGVAWIAISQFSNQGFQFIVTAILARLLFPEDFGIVGMAVIFTGLARTVNELGLGAAIVQRKELDESHRATSFWASMAMGILIFVTVLIAAPFVADFFRKEIVAPVMIVSSISFLIGPFGVIHRSLLTREMSFKKLATTEIGSTVISGILAIVMAFTGFGVWSLVCRGILHDLVTAAFLWAMCPWRPSMHFSLESFKQLFGFGASVTGARFVNYLQANVDYMIVGRILGASSLGLYTLAYRLVTMPLEKVSGIVTRVAFPAFSNIQDDDPRLRRGYLKEVAYISLVTFPMLAGLFVVAPEFVRVVFGGKWIPAILSLQILCIVGARKSIGTTVGSVIYSKGRPDIDLKWNIFALASLTTVILVGSRYGIVGVASAIALLGTINFPIMQWITNRLISLSFRRYLSALYPATFGSATMLAILFVYRMVLHTVFHQNDLFILISSVILGVIVYFTALKIAKVKALDEILQLISGVLKPRLQSVLSKAKALRWT
jgi:O-antigen/teichoic acid export membrane protein